MTEQLLVVDDDPALLKVAKVALEREGYEVQQPRGALKDSG